MQAAWALLFYIPAPGEAPLAQGPPAPPSSEPRTPENF